MSRPARWAATAVQTLSPGYFPFMMATSIISTAAFLLGPSWLSQVLLVVATVALGVLIVALVGQLVRFRASAAATFRDPGQVFGFFAMAAAMNVLGIRLAAAGHPLATAILAGLAAAVWLALTYAVPASLLLIRSRDSVVGDVNGTWLLWVVGTQSVSVGASTLIPAWPSQAALLAPVAVGLWSIGLLLYLLLVSLILLHWLTVPMTPQALGPPYWILMGAGGFRCSSCSACGVTSGSTGRWPTSPRCGAWSSRSACTASRRSPSAAPSTWPSWPRSADSCSG